MLHSGFFVAFINVLNLLHAHRFRCSEWISKLGGGNTDIFSMSEAGAFCWQFSTPEQTTGDATVYLREKIALLIDLKEGAIGRGKCAV